MAAANLTTHGPMQPYQTISGNTPNTKAMLEKAGQTFPVGVPVQQVAGSITGTPKVIQVWDASVTAATSIAGIAGISGSSGLNLATDGLGSPSLNSFGSVGAPGATSTFGKVPNQASAVNIARGEPMSDGNTYFFVANNDTLFIGQVDNSAGAVAADYTAVASDIGKQFGLTSDGTGKSWYVDRGKTTVGTNTVVEVVALDPNSVGQTNNNVIFRFLTGIQQYSQ